MSNKQCNVPVIRGTFAESNGVWTVQSEDTKALSAAAKAGIAYVINTRNGKETVRIVEGVEGTHAVVGHKVYRSQYGETETLSSERMAHVEYVDLHTLAAPAKSESAPKSAPKSASAKSAPKSANDPLSQVLAVLDILSTRLAALESSAHAPKSAPKGAPIVSTHTPLTQSIGPIVGKRANNHRLDCACGMCKSIDAKKAAKVAHETRSDPVLVAADDASAIAAQVNAARVAAFKRSGNTSTSHRK